MTTKLILNTIELDLSNYEYTLIEENNWLQDNTISKFTYPVEIELTNEQDEALGYISQMNLNAYNTLLEAKFYVLGEEHDAVLEIESIIGRKMVTQIRYGLEEFPNFNKRLSELPLEKFNLLVSIYTHAESIITQTWPAVNYNFPQVITDSIDTSQEQWQYFEGIINNRKSSNFLQNSFDAVENEQVNANLIIPMPYLFHILEVGFADAGFTLAGEILEDTYYKKATAFALTEFYKSFTTQSEEYIMNSDEGVIGASYIEEAYEIYGFEKYISLPEPGRYKIAGNVIVRGKFHNGIASAKFAFNGSNTWDVSYQWNFYEYREEFHTVDFNIDYTGTEGDIYFRSAQISYAMLDGERIEAANIMDITVTQLAKYDENGELISTLVEPTAIDLSKSVPDMTFGEYVTAVMKKRNYGYDIDGNTITINKRRTRTLDKTKAIDLSKFEVPQEDLERNFNRGKSFEFKSFEYESDEYPHQKIFITNTGYQINSYTTNDDTEEIIINAIALPLKIYGVKTAHDFLNDNAKLQLVLYSGLSAGVNISEDPAGISLLNNYLDDYQDWFNFLLTSQNLVWLFDSSYEELPELKIRSIIYAYRQYHIIRKLTRTTYLSGKKGILLEHEMDTESLE